MPKVVEVQQTDQPQYKRYILDEEYEGYVYGDVDDLRWESTGPEDPRVTGGLTSHKAGELVGTVNAFVPGRRWFVMAGNVTKLTFADGSTWTPEVPPAAPVAADK